MEKELAQLAPTYLVREKSQIPSENTIFAESNFSGWGHGNGDRGEIPEEAY